MGMLASRFGARFRPFIADFSLITRRARSRSNAPAGGLYLKT